MLRIKCTHGFFTISETAPGDVGRFMSLYPGLAIVAYRDQFTFAALVDAPDFSIKGDTYLGVEAEKTIAGDPGEVMRANKIVFDFNTGKAKPIASITYSADLSAGAYYYLSNGLIVPGSLTDEGARVTDYVAWYAFSEAQFKYSEVTLVD